MNLRLNDAWRYYLRLTRLEKGRLAASVVLLIGKSFIYVPVVVLVRYAFDTAIPSGDWNGFLINTVIVLVFMILISLVGIWARRQSLKASKAVLQAFRVDLLRRVLAFSRARYTTVDLKRIRFAIMSETDRLETMNFAFLTQVLPGLISGIVLVGILLFLNWTLVLVLFLLVPLLGLAGYYFRRRILAYHLRYINHFQSLSGDINQMLNLLDLVHLQSAEEEELVRRRSAIAEANAASEDLWNQRMLFTEFQYFALTVVALFIFVAGSWTVIRGTMPSGDLASFYMVLGLLISVIRPVWSSYPQMITGHSSLLQLYEIISDRDAQPYAGSRKIDFSGRVSFEDVTFGYGDRDILARFNLDIAPGEKVVVLGPNGIGKTTLLHLLLGFYRPCEGRITVDGIPLDELDLFSLRRQIGVISQNSMLWPGTLWENLAYGNPGASREDILAASRIASVEEFVSNLDAGYDTLLGEQGVLLSGGQRQRIEIARALVRKPKLLVLDEVTNHLDRQSGYEILKAISSLDYAPAILFITHDLRVLDFADRVIEFPAGPDTDGIKDDVPRA